MIHRKNPLELLGEKYGASKRIHNYLQHYWTHLRDISLDVKNVCEIGVQTPNSVRMWEEFFPNATIHGIDIDNNCKSIESGRVKIHIGSQNDMDFLNSVVSSVGVPFDVVIDDGSHQVDHQINTFNFLFPRLSEHGIYALEDTGPVVGDMGSITVNALRSFTDSINYWPPGFLPQNWPYLGELPADTAWQHKNIVGLAFYRWIVFIFRGRNPQDNPYLLSPNEIPGRL